MRIKAHCSQFALSLLAMAVASTASISVAHAGDTPPAAAAAPAAPAPAAKPAPAKPLDKKTKDAARAAYKDGEKAYAAGDFAGAYAGFEKANALIPAP
jgi:hypothetical protein